MSNIFVKQIEIFIPPYRTAILENLLRVAQQGPFASMYPDTLEMNIEVKEVILDSDGEIADELPDITDALIDTTNCNYTENREEQEEVIMSNRTEKPTVNSPSANSHKSSDLMKVESLLDDIILRARAQGRTGQIDLSLEESEIDKLVSEIGTIDTKAQYERVEMADPFTEPLPQKDEVEEELQTESRGVKRVRPTGRLVPEVPEKREKKPAAPLYSKARQLSQVNSNKAAENSKQEKTANDVLVFSPRQVEPKIRKRRISKTERRGLAIGLMVFSICIMVTIVGLTYAKPDPFGQSAPTRIAQLREQNGIRNLELLDLVRKSPAKAHGSTVAQAMTSYLNGVNGPNWQPVGWKAEKIESEKENISIVKFLWIEQGITKEANWQVNSATSAIKALNEAALRVGP